MPYIIKTDDGKFCVYKEGADGGHEGEPLGCHETEKEAVAQIGAIESQEQKTKNINMFMSGEMGLDEYRQKVEKAWYDHANHGWIVEFFSDRVIACVGDKYWEISMSFTDSGDMEFAANNEWKEVVLKQEWEQKSLCIKKLGAKRIGAYGVLWGNEERKDLHGEFFTPDTEELTAVFKSMGKIPYIVEHAGDDKIKTVVAGEVDVMEIDDTGLWWEAKIIDHEAYAAYVRPLLEREYLYSSSGTLPAARRVKKNGEITRWPIVEMTGTVAPAEFRMLDRPIDQIKTHYKSIGLDFLDENDQADQSVVVDEAEGAEEARRIQTRINQSRLNLQLSQF